MKIETMLHIAPGFSVCKSAEGIEIIFNGTAGDKLSTEEARDILQAVLFLFNMSEKNQSLTTAIYSSLKRTNLDTDVTTDSLYDAIEFLDEI